MIILPPENPNLDVQLKKPCGPTATEGGSMLYLDTSALLKLHCLEEGSRETQAALEAQDDPIPVWEIQEMELRNAFRLKVFWNEWTTEQAERQEALFLDRRRRGLYYTPDIQRSELFTTFLELTLQTPTLGCRTLDILHVAAAKQQEISLFLTFDQRQRKLALASGLHAPQLTSD